MLVTLVMSINQAVSGATRSTSGSEIVNADLAVQARSAGGISTSLARRLRAAAAPAPATFVLQVNTRLSDGDEGSDSYLSVLGVDQAARSFLPPGIVANVAKRKVDFDAPPLVVGEEWLRRQGLRVGDRIRLQSARGTSPWVIAGSIEGDLPNGGAIAVGPIERVGFAFARPRAVDTLYLQVKDGGEREALVERLQAVGKSAVVVGSLGLVGSSSARSLLAVQALLLVAGFVGLLSAAVVVFVCWRLLIEDERASIARLRLVGATPLQLAAGSGAVLLPATLACCLIALPCGVLVAALLHKLTSQLVGFTGLAATFDENAGRTPMLVGLAAALLIAAAAWAAGIRAFVSISPLEAIRPADQPPPSRSVRWRALGAGIAALLSAGITTLFLPLSFGAAGVVLTIVGALFLVMGMVVPLGGALASSGSGFASLAAGRQIAADSRRTAAITLMVGLGVTAWLTLGGVASSYQQAIDRSVRSWTHADLFVRMGEPGQTLRDSRFPPGVQRRLARVPGVAQAGAFTFVLMDYRGRNLMFQAYDTHHVEGVADLIVYSGVKGMKMWRALAKGEIAISQSMARLDGLEVGDRVLLPGTRGSRRLRIASVIDDYVSEGGTVVGSLATFRALTGERRIDDIPLVLEPGVSTSLVAARVRNALPGYDALTILDRRQFRASITEFISGVIMLFQGLAVVAFFIVLMAAILVVAASLAVRRRSLAVSRLVGVSPRQIRLQLFLETGAMALIAWMLAAVVSSLLVPNMLHATAARTGLLPAVDPPAKELALTLPIGLAVALAAGAVAAHMVLRDDIAETLRFE
jgi:putative ABC transport system permease protein